MGRAEAATELQGKSALLGDEETLTGRPVARAETPVFPVPGWDRYTCIRFLGQGAMGNVFLARDVRLQRDVAMKFVRGNEPTCVQRLLVEARAQARVEHGAVCKVFEVGEVEGHLYIAMQYIAGRPLRQWLGELAAEEQAMVIRDAALGIHAAHVVGIVHRDIKPGNILVERDGQGVLRPCVMDFGVARLRAGGTTEAGAVLGTPHYMAPEQARGETDTLDRRADVYGLGATLYFLLTGEPPVRGESTTEVLHHITGEEPPPARRNAPDAPPDLRAIALKCLEADRSHRYDSALALADDLDRFVRGEPVEARPATRLARSRRWLRKRRGAVIPLAIAIFAMLLAAGWTVLVRREAAEREHLAAELAERAAAIETLAGYSAMAPAHDTRDDRKALRGALEGLEADIAKAGSAADGLGALALGRAHLALGEWDRAEAALESAWAAGLREQGLSRALGRVKLQRYKLAQAAAASLREPAERARRKREIERQHRAPALEYLHLAESRALPAEAFVLALALYHEGRPEEALRLLAPSAAVAPWQYEAPELRGDILFERAARRWSDGDGEGATNDFNAARQAYTEEAAIGRSAPSPHEAQARLAHVEMVRALREGMDATPAFERGMTAITRALALDPERDSALRSRARLIKRFAEPPESAAPASCPAPPQRATADKSEALDAFFHCLDIEVPSP